MKPGKPGLRELEDPSSSSPWAPDPMCLQLFHRPPAGGRHGLQCHTLPMRNAYSQPLSHHLQIKNAPKMGRLWVKQNLT